MKLKNPTPETLDTDNPEWTAADFKKAVPFFDMLPQLKPAVKRTIKPHKKHTSHLKAA